MDAGDSRSWQRKQYYQNLAAFHYWRKNLRGPVGFCVVNTCSMSCLVAS